MKPVLQVAFPPAKPLLIYDGDCKFCALWIRRWQSVTGPRVDYLACQNPRVIAQFPEIPREQFESAVQLIQPDGAVSSAAEAVFRSLAADPHGKWLFDLYQHFAAFARLAEWSYGFVARRRKLFSVLTRLLWGRHVEPPSQIFVRRVFLRSLGVIYLIALVSLWMQITGLVGSNGIMPAQATMKLADQQLPAGRIGLDRYHWLPTMCWLGAGDGALKFQCAAGTVLAVLLIAGIAPAPCLFLLWLIYLSLTTVCGVFLGFQWDNLLLETGFLAIFFAPRQFLPSRASEEAPPSRIVLWLLRWLLFRLMFESGCVKYLSGDPAWRHLTALKFHYETQPLPTWIGWYAHQLPVPVQTATAAIMFGIELGVPFLIFLPRKPRQIACGAFSLLQLAIFLTGNYCFFNLLTLLLCLTLLDDAAFKWFQPGDGLAVPAPNPQSAGLKPVKHRRWPVPVTSALLVIVLGTSFVQLSGIFGVRLPGPEPVLAAYRWLMPFRTFNEYGLFAVMTTSRPEIVVEGSNDGVHWAAYEFKYKAGDVKRRPGFVAPHQPRLDWQMWFAALGGYRENPWFVNFCVRLLQGNPEVLALLGNNPFPEAPPRYIRALLYEYEFTTFAARRQTGDWWRRELKGIYLPPLSLFEAGLNRDAARWFPPRS